MPNNSRSFLFLSSRVRLLSTISNILITVSLPNAFFKILITSICDMVDDLDLYSRRHDLGVAVYYPRYSEDNQNVFTHPDAFWILFPYKLYFTLKEVTSLDPKKVYSSILSEI